MAVKLSIYQYLPRLNCLVLYLQVSDEAKYVTILKSDRTKQLNDLSARMDENISVELQNRKAFEDDLRNIVTSILVSDDSRRDAFQLKYEEEQQNIIVCELLPLSVFFVAT